MGDSPQASLQIRAKSIFEFVQHVEKLKTEYRQASKSDGSKESAAEHSWMLSLMVLLVVPNLEKSIDLEKALKLSIVHDIVEVDGNDTPVLQAMADQDVKAQKKLMELSAIEKIRSLLGQQGQDVYDLWMEFEENQTPEANVVNALDKIEGQWQFLSDPVYQFDDFDREHAPKLLEDTTKRSEIDPFLSALYAVSKPAMQDRIDLEVSKQ